MHKKLSAFIKSLVKPLLIFTLVFAIVFGQVGGAWAARGGGRIGGGNFRVPSRTYAPPSRTYAPPRGGYYPGGGGFGFPFLVPVFGIGGGFGGLFTILIFISIAGFLVRSFRGATEGYSSSGYDTYGGSPTVSVAKLQVGLLASARSLQTDLDRIAQTANTGSSVGLAQVLQESTLSLLRHPEYWAYASSETEQARLEAAENVFNRLTLTERSKFSEETLSNFNNQLKQAPDRGVLPAAGGELAQTIPTESGEYILVTLLAAKQGKMQLPNVNSADDLRRALSQMGAIPAEELLAVEVLWTPQREGDTLSADELVSEYPDLKLV